MIRLILFSCLIFCAFAENAEHEFQTFDGWWNNPTKGDWGSADWRMGSRMFQAYGDGVYTPAGEGRPNPVEISDAIFKYPDPNVPTPSFLSRTTLNAFFAQHVWHEILDQYRFQCHPEFFHIAVPKGDKRMDPTGRGDVFIPFWRARYDVKTGQSPNTPRMFLNEETSWIDGSSVYGTGKMWSDFLRSFNKGRLRCLGEEKEAKADLAVVDCNFPALNDIGLPMTNPPPPREHAVKDSRRLFRFGNKRAHENPGILALQILWFREHNFQADRIANDNPNLNDDQIFFLARQRVIAEMQHVMLDEWFPQFSGVALPAFSKFSTSTPPGVTNEFSIAFRYAETMLPPGFFLRDNNCQYKNFQPPGSAQSFIGARLCNLYWNAQDLFNINASLPRAQSGLDEIIGGMASQIAEGEDPFFTEDVRTFAYGGIEFSRRDLMAVHIQRGRDYGLPDYNTARFNYQLLPFQDFNNFTNNTELNNVMSGLYKNNISNVDLFVGGMVESLGNPGPLWINIFIDVLLRVRDGDRFWFENDLTGFLNTTEIQTIKTTSFKTIILRNTGILATSIQNNPFKFNGGDPCPQPKQLAQTDMEPCTGLLFHDFLSISFSHIPLLAVTTVLYICLVMLILYLLVLKREGFKLKVVTNQVQQMSDTTGKDGTKLAAAVEEVTEDKMQKDRAVYLAVKGGKLAIFDQNQKPVREVDCRLIERVVLSGTKDLAKLLVIIPKEYDILVCFADSVRRHEFFMLLKKGANKEIFMDNASERHVYSIMKTKDARKKELKKFFNLAIQTVVGRADKKEVNLPPEIYEQELSRDEFADSFSIAKNSLFVSQLFSLVDKDGSGYVNFREFLDFMGVFYNGSSDDKLTFLFDLYDTEKAGAISRESLGKMLRSNMEISNVQHIEKDSINQMVDAIFKQCGLGADDKIRFKEFKEFMGKAAAQGMSIDVKSDLQVKQEKKKKGTEVDAKQTLAQATDQNFDRGQTFMINKQMRDQLTGQGEAPQSYTVLFTPQQLKEIREGKEQDANPLSSLTSAYSGQGGNNKEALSKVETKDPRDSGTLGKIIAYMRDNRASIFILAAYIMSGAIVFGERAYTYSITKEHAGLRRIAGFGVTTTRGAASAMMFNFSLLLATMVRNIFTKLRSGTFLGVALHKFIPFDNIYIFHKLVALVALFWVAVHIVGHFINFFHINTQPADNLACIFKEVYHLSFDLPNFSWWFFATVTGFSGFLLVLVIIVMYLFSSNYSRRHVFAAFWTTHHVCAVLLYILLVLHGSARLVQQPIFYIFFLPPGILFVFDQLMSVGRNRIEVPVIEAELLPSGVTKVVYKRPDDFEYKGGQWIRIACLAISSFEYHPFTLTSAPHEKHLSNHIRAVGPWTNALRATYDPKQVRLGALPNLYIDGPYGEGHQDWNNFEYCVLVGGGIGVTPFAGILKDIVHQINNNRTIFMKKCYFMWVCRNQKQFEWLVDIIRECENKDTAGILEVHIFITELQQKYDLRSTMLHVCERTFQKISNKSLFTGCRALTHFGRPNFANLFGQLQIAHSHAARIGVFSCGPPAMTYGVDDGAIAANKNLTGPRFHHHFENF